jgi:ureidoglycolate dehydrogenase (NAD+)
MHMKEHKIRLHNRELFDFVKLILNRAGIPDDDAKVTADVLLSANLCGIDSHGVVRLSHYLRRIKNGTIKKRPHVRHERKTPGLAVVDGDDGLGHVVTARATNFAMELCREAGTASVVVKNSSHFGMTGYYVRMMTQRGFAGMVMTHTDSFLIPYGGRKPFLGTNPVAIGFPTGGVPLVLDMSTTSIPYGKVVIAKKEGRSIPKDWGFDENGEPTTDPFKIAGLHPVAGYKGSGLAMVIDIFCSLFSGMAFGPHINRMYVDLDSPRKLGHFIVAWDIERVLVIENFQDRIQQMIDELRSIPPAAGFERVFYPGEIEGITRNTRVREGIPVEDGLYRELCELGKEFGVQTPKPVG